MPTPGEALALSVLVDATKFLFDELGRRLTFWKKKRAELQDRQSSSEQPISIESLLKRRSRSELEEKAQEIESLMAEVKEHISRTNALEEKLADPLLPLSIKVETEKRLQAEMDVLHNKGLSLADKLEEVYGIELIAQALSGDPTTRPKPPKAN